MKVLELSQGLKSIVDDEDYEFLSKYKWSALRRTNGLFYAIRTRKKLEPKGSRMIYLHREILKAKKGQFIDHINNDSLDNRKQNLRFCSKKENCRNRLITTKNTSGYKGVVWHTIAKKWIASIKVNQKYIYLGLFIDKKQAAKAYNNAAIKYFGEFCKLNEGV